MSLAIILVVFTLSGCSDSATQIIPKPDSSGGGVSPGTQNPDGGTTGGDTGTAGSGSDVPDTSSEPVTTIAGDPTIAALPAGTRAQAYAGTYDGSAGVFIIDDNDRLIGLVNNQNDGSRSLRADISNRVQSTTRVQQFAHEREPTRNGFQLKPFAEASAATESDAAEIVLEVVDGQRISSVGSDVSLDLLLADDSTLLPVSNASLQGDWIGAYSLCDSDKQNCSQFAWRMNVAGANITGTTGLFATDGTDLLPSAVSGSFSQRGPVLDITFTWNTYRYDGFAFVDTSNTNQLLIVATTDSEIADERMLATSMVRLR